MYTKAPSAYHSAVGKFCPFTVQGHAQALPFPFPLPWLPWPCPCLLPLFGFPWALLPFSDIGIFISPLIVDRMLLMMLRGLSFRLVVAVSSSGLLSQPSTATIIPCHPLAFGSGQSAVWWMLDLHSLQLMDVVAVGLASSVTMTLCVPM